MSEPEYLTVVQVAELFQYAPITIYRMLARGELPGRKVGGQWRFSRAALEAWFNEPAATGEGVLADGTGELLPFVPARD